MSRQPAFLSKPIETMSDAEWESICDGCGLCCQIRVEDIDSGEVVLSNVACRYLCLKTHHCKDYANRHQNVRDCVKVTPQNVHELDWLPVTCGYRLVAAGQPLRKWHPLISGDPERVHRYGPSMRGDVISEDDADWGDDEEE